MAMYWTFSSLPELSHLTERDRHDVLRTCVGPGVYLRLIRSALFFGLAATAIVLHFFMRGAGTVATAIAGCVVAAAAFIFVYQFHMRVIRADLRLALIKGFAGERLPVCLGCGYDLKGITAELCPECGKGIVVRRAEHEDSQ